LLPLRAERVLRLSICSQRTMPEDIDRTFEAIARIGRTLARQVSRHFIAAR
jgi:hypothetical protein